MTKKAEFNIEMVKKYIFWVCTPIGLLVALLAGFMAIGSVSEEVTRQHQALQSQKQAAETLRSGAPTHPNQGTIDSINEKRATLQEDVLVAWQTMVEAQEEQNRWEGLAVNVINEIAGKQFLDPLSSTVLQNYLNFAQSEINRLLDKTGIRRVELRNPQNGEPLERLVLATEGGGSGSRSSRGSRASGTESSWSSTSGQNAVLMGKVVWNSPQLDITMKNWQQQPHPFEVWLTQEDLWVYQALLWVVRESNKNAPERRIPASSASLGSGRSSSGRGGDSVSGSPSLNLRESVIKEIVELTIGKQAGQELQRQSSQRIGGGSGGFGDDFSSGSFESFSGGGFGSDSMGMGMGGGVSVESLRDAAMSGRYVDVNGSPMMSPDLGGQIRRMPVYLRLVVDQNRIHEVLANCANSPMPIDVLWVNFNPDAGQSFNYVSATGASGLGESGSGFSSRSSSRSGRGTAGRSSGGGSSMSSGNIDYGPNAVTIEIFGCINIFTPPDPNKIGGEPQS